MTYSFIWDLDGTLIDSYGMMVESLHTMISEHKISIEPFEIRQIILRGTVGDFFRKIENEYGIPAEEQQIRYKEICANLWTEIVPMNGSIETLKKLTEKGARNFIFTHRDNLTFDILKNINMDGYFEEIVTCERGFGWKPSPNGVNYIVDTYGLSRDKTFYVGDRNLDIECGFNAGIGTIFFRE